MTLEGNIASTPLMKINHLMSLNEINFHLPTKITNILFKNMSVLYRIKYITVFTYDFIPALKKNHKSRLKVKERTSEVSLQTNLWQVQYEDNYK